MRVIEVDPFSDERWERYVTAQPRGLVYHRAAWLRVLRRDYGDTFVNLLCEDCDGAVAGVLPLCRTRGLPLGLGGTLGGPRLTSLPRTPIGGPLASSVEAATALVEAAIARVGAMGGVRLQVKAPLDLGDRLRVLPPVPGDTSYVLPLPERPEDLRFGSSRNHAAIRRAVKKADRLGLEVRPADSEDELRAWYRLYLCAMRKHVAAPRPYRFFRAMWDILRPLEMMELLLAADGPRLLAGCLLLKSNRTVVFGFNGRGEEDLAARPNDAIHWRAIHDACCDGYRFYDFGEVADSNPGLAQFKLKWGAQPQRLYRYHYPAALPHDGNGAVAAATMGRVEQALRAGWQRVPIPVTARVGELLYRYV